MRLFKALILTLALCGAAFAQEQPNAAGGFDPNWPTRVFIIRYADLSSIDRLLMPFAVPHSTDPSLRAISVHAPAATITAIEELIKQFDIPANVPKNIELTAFVVAASSQGEAESIPATIKPVVDQLRNVMAYKSYRVVDTIIARAAENYGGGNGINSDGIIPKLSQSDSSDQPVFEDFSVNRLKVVGDNSNQSIHLEGLKLTVKPYLNGGYMTLTISTALDVKLGQQVVVGKAALQDRALILILSGKVVN